MQTLHVSRDMARVLSAAVTTGQFPWIPVPESKRAGRARWPSAVYCKQVSDTTMEFLRRSLAQDELYKRMGYLRQSPAPVIHLANGWNGWSAQILERMATDLPDGGWEVRAWDAQKHIIIRQPANGAAVVEWSNFPGLDEWIRPPIPAHTGPVRRF